MVSSQSTEDSFIYTPLEDYWIWLCKWVAYREAGGPQQTSILVNRKYTAIEIWVRLLRREYIEIIELLSHNSFARTRNTKKGSCWHC